MKKQPPIASATIAIMATVATYFLVRGVIWSLDATINYASVSMRDPTIGSMIGVIVQFGQQLALFVKNRAVRFSALYWVCWVTFGGSFLLDALTNVGEWSATRPTYPGNWSQAQRTGGDAFAIAMCIGATIYEEVVSYSAAWMLHYWNEVLKALGHTKFSKALEWMEEQTERTQVSRVKAGGEEPKQEAPKQEGPKPGPQNPRPAHAR